MPTRIPNPRLHHDHIVLVSVTDGSDSRSPEWQDEVILPFALAYLPDGIGVERLVCVILGVELEERLAPVMTAILLLLCEVIGYFPCSSAC